MAKFHVNVVGAGVAVVVNGLPDLKRVFSSIVRPLELLLYRADLFNVPPSTSEAAALICSALSSSAKRSEPREWSVKVLSWYTALPTDADVKAMLFVHLRPAEIHVHLPLECFQFTPNYESTYASTVRHFGRVDPIERFVRRRRRQPKPPVQHSRKIDI